MAFGLLGDSQLRSVEAFFLLAVFNLAGAILNPNTTIYSNSGSSLWVGLLTMVRVAH